MYTNIRHRCIYVCTAEKDLQPAGIQTRKNAEVCCRSGNRSVSAADVVLYVYDLFLSVYLCMFEFAYASKLSMNVLLTVHRYATNSV
jgi:hypothetical protein